MAFLAVLAETASVRHACRGAGIGWTAAYAWKKDDAEFAAEWEAAIDEGVASLEDEVARRAFKGVDKPVFHQGERCGEWQKDGKRVDPDTEGAEFVPYVIKEFSDLLSIFLLKAHRPERYRERFEHTGAGGGPIQTEDLTNPLETARRLAFLLRAGAEAAATAEAAAQSHKETAP